MGLQILDPRFKSGWRLQTKNDVFRHVVFSLVDIFCAQLLFGTPIFGRVRCGCASSGWLPLAFFERFLAPVAERPIATGRTAAPAAALCGLIRFQHNNGGRNERAQKQQCDVDGFHRTHPFSQLLIIVTARARKIKPTRPAAYRWPQNRAEKWRRRKFLFALFIFSVDFLCKCVLY